MNNRPLQAKDLMLGDWVLWGYTTASGVKVGGYKMQVAAIYQDNLVDLIDSDSLYERVPMDEVEAIPLTEKALEKSGFNVGQYSSWTEHYTSYSLLNDKGHRIVIVDFKEGKLNSMEVYGFMIDIESHNIKSVHELQHALRLAGIGKEIEL